MAIDPWEPGPEGAAGEGEQGDLVRARRDEKEWSGGFTLPGAHDEGTAGLLGTPHQPRPAHLPPAAAAAPSLHGDLSGARACRRPSA